NQGHQLKGVNLFACPENRSMTAEARQSMVDLVQHSSASVKTIASMLKYYIWARVFGKDVYIRTTSTLKEPVNNSRAKFVQASQDEG
ncbi:hypothetical protein V1525DRAFT_324772, partial [Lipomyces kononenkoae]